MFSMKNDVEDVSHFSPLNKDQFLFDTNVLIRIFYTNGDYSSHQNEPYIALYTNIIKSNSKIILPSAVISEFVTTYIKKEYQRLEPSRKDDWKYFKNKFRKSLNFQTIMAELNNIIYKQLLPLAMQIDDAFNAVCIKTLISELDSMDFNDAYYLNIAENNGYFVVTHDIDLCKNFIGKSPVKILTANKRALKEKSFSNSN